MSRSPKANALTYIRSAIYWVVMALVVMVIALTGLLTAPLPFKKRYKYLAIAPKVSIEALKLICGVNYKVENLGGSLPEDAAIVMSKHQSTWETFAFTFIFPPQVWVLKDSIMKIPFFGWGMALLNPIAIDRTAGTKALEQVVEQGRDRLDSGAWVVIFPEGTRVPVGTKRRYKTGGAYLAAQTGYPVIPVAHNAGLYWPKDSFLKYPGTVTVRIGAAIDTEGKSLQEINKEVENWIETQMAELENI